MEWVLGILLVGVTTTLGLLYKWLYGDWKEQREYEDRLFKLLELERKDSLLFK